MTLPTTSTVERPQQWGYDAQVGNLLLRLAPAQGRELVTEMAELEPPRFQTESSPEEALSSFGDIFSLGSATGGEGLLLRYRRGGTERDATRFWDSKNVDVSPTDQGVPDEIRLLNTTEVVDEISGTVRVASHGTTVWATSGTTLRKTTDITANPPVFTDDNPHAGGETVDVLDVATLGSVVYAARDGEGITRDDGGWASWSNLEAVRIWEALDRIIASTGDALYEADGINDSVLLYTLPDGETWTDVVAAAGSIFASATNGVVYTFDLDEDQALVIGAQSELKGESTVAMAARSSQLFVAATSGDELRLWRADISSGVLDDLQLIREWTGGDGHAMAATRDRIYFGVNEDNGTHLWQVELVTGGIFRSLSLADGDVDSLVPVGDVIVGGIEGEGVFREIDALETSGYLMTPLADFFRAEVKNWISGWADVRVASGQQVDLFYTTEREALFDEDSGLWKRIRTYTVDSTGIEVGLGGVRERWLAGMVKLTGSAEASPTVRSLSFRSYPAGGDVLVRLPVDVSDQVERFGKRRLRSNGFGKRIYGAIRDLEGRSLTCRIFRLDETVRGLVENVQVPIQQITPYGTVTWVSLVTIRGRRISESVPSVNLDGTWGSYDYGGRTYGGQDL